MGLNCFAGTDWHGLRPFGHEPISTNQPAIFTLVPPTSAHPSKANGELSATIPRPIIVTGEVMARNGKQKSKIGLAILCGFVVAAIAAGVHFAILPHDRTIMLPSLLGDFIAGLTAVVVCLAIQLKQEEVHYQTAIERAAIVAELNHHVRNAIFPLFLAVQKVGDGEALKAANDAVERINIALRDATSDALTGKVDYSETRDT